MTASNIYRLSDFVTLRVTHHKKPTADNGSRDIQPLREAWGLRAGIYTPKKLVDHFAPLLNTVVFHLGDKSLAGKPARTCLLDNLAANLATNTREATLRLSEPLDVSRREMNNQAARIGEALVEWARESSTQSFDPDMYLRSPCEGHLLTPSNVDLMFGDRSQPHLMQLFNEYMHQMVLLRDALLPFQNYQDVLIPVGRKARGIRHLESARSQFLADLLTRHTTQRNVVTFAKAFLAPGLLHSESVGYGFQYAHGTVLPAFLSGGPTPLHLLQYVPVRIDHTKTDIVFDYRFEDYYAARRTELPTGINRALSDLARLPVQGVTARKEATVAMAGHLKSGENRILEMCLALSNGKCVSVDLGQIARGHRYSYTIEYPTANGSIHTNRARSFHSAVIHDPVDILEAAGTSLLTTKEGGVHVIPTQDPLVALAILGKLYPENVVLLPSEEELEEADKAGKGFEPKFVIWGGSRPGGIKGVFH
ncbi:hypothetical protein N7532_012087 [Penicillium argentinense]|uniref:Uncharacterized protein n=1 Tax=Penicillium argentinense TaxID=1131581 RepID=A0A9W9EJP6_9EURO|nr:uncharacterized protein N7532_012087 [Penicillium argentinense]KAJ5083044.1 hypothetical protein N7532_012087 [Penicillium argentinense]